MPGSVLEIEKENYGPDREEHRQLHCYSICAKRYALYNLDEHGQPTLRCITDGNENDEPADSDEPADALTELRKHSEHGLGHLLNPTNPESECRDWIAQLWQHIIRTDAHSQAEHDTCPPETQPRGRARQPARERAGEPEWLDRPALTRITITSPRLLKPFEHRSRKQPSSKRSRKRPAADRIRPYNFVLIAHVHEPGLPGLTRALPACRPLRVGPAQVAPVALDQRLRARHAATDRPRRTDTGEQSRPRSTARSSSKTYRTVLDDYRTHPEAKSLGSDGRPCDRATVGLLSRRPVKAAAIHYIGKESNKIEEAMSGLGADLDDVLTEYRDPGQDPLWRLAVEALQTLPVEQVAAGAGVSERTVKRARAGQSIGGTVRAKLTEHAVRHAGAWLRAKGIRSPAGPESLLAIYLGRQNPPVYEPRLCACGCGRPVKRGRRGPAAKWHSDACRKRAARRAA